jgi:hypothetical protein
MLLFRCRGSTDLAGLRFYITGDRALLRGVECDGVIDSPSSLTGLIGGRE